MRHIRFAIPIALGLLTTSCGSAISFSAHTAVDPRGNVIRTTRYSATGEPSYEELLGRYDLPAGGDWTEQIEYLAPVNEASEPLSFARHTYALSRRFSRGEGIPSDFSRRAISAATSARNRIAVDTRHYWVADVYDYEETFTDIVTEAALTSAVEQIYRTYVGVLADEIARLPAAGLNTAQAMSRLTATGDRIIEQLLEVVHTACFDRSKTMEDCQSAMEGYPELTEYVEILNDNERLLDELMKIVPAPAAIDPGDWRETLRTEVVESLGQREELAASNLIDPIEEQIFGVHGFVLFRTYPFEISVSLPGVYVASNADSQEDGLLRWVFASEVFVLHEHTLFARARLLHWNRILFSLTCMIVLAGIFGVIRRDA